MIDILSVHQVHVIKECVDIRRGWVKSIIHGLASSDMVQSVFEFTVLKADESSMNKVLT